jgi:soluble lytic murein transglycosylase-like protein
MRIQMAVLFAGALFATTVVDAGSAWARGTMSASPLDRWSPLFAEASRRFGIPEPWIRAVMRAESDGHATLDGQPITSRAGAIGLMQLMPATWSELRDRLGLGIDAYDPRDNILAGTAYLRWLYERYGYPGLFAAYNAGPARFDDQLFGHRPLPAETLAYLAALGQPAIGPGRTSPLAVSGNSLFFSLHTTTERASDSPLMSSSGGLFVSLNSARE